MFLADVVGVLLDIFLFIEKPTPRDPDPSYSVLKVGDKVYSRNRDMTQNIILQGCDLERSRSSVTVNKFSIRPRHPPISTHVKFH